MKKRFASRLFVVILVLSVVCATGCKKEGNTDTYEPWLETNDVKVTSVYQSHWTAPYWYYYTNDQGELDSAWFDESNTKIWTEYEWDGNKLLSISSKMLVSGYESEDDYTFVYENNRLAKIVSSQYPEWYVNIKYDGNKISEVEKYHSNDLYKKVQFQYNDNWPTRIICNSNGGVYTYNLSNDGKNITSFSYDLDGEHISYDFVYDEKVNPLKGVIMFLPQDIEEGICIHDFPFGVLSWAESNSVISPLNSNNVIRYSDYDYRCNYQYEGDFPKRITWRKENERDTVIFEYAQPTVSKL